MVKVIGKTICCKRAIKIACELKTPLICPSGVGVILMLKIL